AHLEIGEIAIGRIEAQENDLVSVACPHLDPGSAGQRLNECRRSLRYNIHLARQQRCRTARLTRHRAHPDRLDDWRSAPPVVKRLKLDAVVLDPIDDLVGSRPDWALAERVCAHFLIRTLGYDADDRRRPGK